MTFPISIHAPRVGRDDLPDMDYVIEAQFQSTRPVWGATHRRAYTQNQSAISIHAPRVGRDLGAADIGTTDTTFQSTRPVWGATIYDAVTVGSSVFQSTRPVWGATNAASEL